MSDGTKNFAHTQKLSTKFRKRQYRRKQFENFEEAHASISQCITFYNDSRPHMSVGYQTPTMVHLQEGIQQKCWKGYYERHPEKMQNVLKNPTEKKQETYDSI